MKVIKSTFLNEENFAYGLQILSDSDPDLARIIKALGPPPMWEREAGFSTLIHIILEQQVSLASARAAYERLLSFASPLTPERFLELDDLVLKEIGFSRQKMAYGRNLAKSVITGQLKIDALKEMDDKSVRAELT